LIHADFFRAAPPRADRRGRAQKIYGWMNMRMGKIGTATTGSPRTRAIVYQDSDISAISNCS
jgi:hypothetical protein